MRKLRNNANQNIAVNEVNIFPFLTNLASLKSLQSQVSIRAKLVKNSALMIMF